MAFVLNQPEWVEEFKPEEKPSLVVLWDDSVSMGTRDVPTGSSSAPESRREAIAHLIEPTSWSALSDRMNVVVEPFATPRSGSRTDLYDPLSEAPEKFKNLIGVVLISDGGWNERTASRASCY